MRNKTGILLILLFIISGQKLYAQADFDTQIKKMGDTLVNRLIRTGKKGVVVTNFLDLQNNVTELGKYLAEAFSIEISNSTLKVIDRSRMNDLLAELKLTEDKLVKPENALKLGELAGVDYIIMGTTVILDKSVDITIKALDIQGGTAIAGQRGSIQRTESINNLLHSTVSGNNGPAANQNVARRIEATDRTATDEIFEVAVSDLRKTECEVYRSYGQNRTEYYGQACFENRTDYDLILYSPQNTVGAPGSGPEMLIPKGGRNCSPRLVINCCDQDNVIKDQTFHFSTTQKNSPLHGTFVVTFEKCKVKSIVLTKRNILLRP